MDSVTPPEIIDLRIAIYAAQHIERAIEEYKQALVTLPPKKHRGAHLRARYALPPTIQDERDEFYLRFGPTKPHQQYSWPYWCWYTALCLEFMALLPEATWTS